MERYMQRKHRQKSSKSEGLATAVPQLPIEVQIIIAQYTVIAIEELCADDLPHDYCARPKTRYTALSNAMLASKAFYAAMAPSLYSDVVLIGSRIMHQFQVSVLERRPDLMKLVRTLTVRLNLEDFGLHHLSAFLLDYRWSNLQHICLLVTSQEERELENPVGHDNWFLLHFHDLSQALKATAMPFQFINPSRYSRENRSGHLFDYNCVAPDQQDSTTIDDNILLTVVEVPFRQQHASIWLLDGVLDDKHISRVGLPLSQEMMNKVRHLKVVRQYQNRDSWSAQHHLELTDDQLLSLEFIAAGQDPLDMETLCETVAGNTHLRSLKLVGNLKMCPHDPQDFWAYLPNSIESLEMTINQLHFIEPLYEDLRQPPRLRLYAPKLRHFICNLDLDIERFTWSGQRDEQLLDKWNVYLEEPESEDENSEEWQQYFRDYNNADIQFMHCFLGLMRHRGIKCTGRGHAGNLVQPVISEHLKLIPLDKK